MAPACQNGHQFVQVGKGQGHCTQGPAEFCGRGSVAKHAPNAKPMLTFVVMVPAPRVVVLEDLGRGPRVKNVVHLVLLSPRQRLAHGLSGFVNVEVPGTQEPKNMLIFGDLLRERRF